MTLLKIAWRNLGRNRRRSLLMIAIVALGTWSIVVLWGITEGFFKTMIDAQVRLDVANLQIHKEGYLDDPATENGIEENALTQLREAINGIEGTHASPRLKIEGLIKSSYGSTGVEVRGISPSEEMKVTQLQDALVEGAYISNSSEIMMGRTLADSLDVRLGENVVLQVQGADRPEAKGFRLVGLLSTGITSLDRGTALISLDAAQELTGLDGATEIAIALNQSFREQNVKQQLNQLLGENYTISALMDLNPLLRDLMRVNYIEMIPIMLILSLLAGFGVANTVMFTVLERTREFGVMMAVGLKPQKLSRLILFESVLTSLMGFAAGAFIGYLFIWYLSAYGLDFSSFVDIFPELGMPHVIYAARSGWYWLYGLTVVFLTALVAAWYPARKATSLEPMEAIRYG